MLTRTTTPSNPLALVTPGRILNSKSASLLEAIQAALPDLPLQLRPVVARVNVPPLTLLAVLAYCYATEVYSSHDVRKYILTDAVCCAALGGEFVFPGEIRAFRHANRSALERCLTAALRFRGEQAADAEMSAWCPEETMIAEEARRRILFAACLDSMELDEACFSC